MSETTNNPATQENKPLVTAEELASLHRQVADQQQEIVLLNESNNELVQKLADHEKEVATLKDANDALTLENEELKESNQQLQDSLDAELVKAGEARPEKEKPIFEHGNTTYEVLVPDCHLAGKGKVTAADIVATPELQAILIESGSGFIREKR